MVNHISVTRSFHREANGSRDTGDRPRETLLGAFFDVTNPMKVSDARASSTSAPDRLRKHWLAAEGSPPATTPRTPGFGQAPGGFEVQTPFLGELPEGFRPCRAQPLRLRALRAPTYEVLVRHFGGVRGLPRPPMPVRASALRVGLAFAPSFGMVWMTGRGLTARVAQATSRPLASRRQVLRDRPSRCRWSQRARLRSRCWERNGAGPVVNRPSGWQRLGSRAGRGDRRVEGPWRGTKPMEGQGAASPATAVQALRTRRRSKASRPASWSNGERRAPLATEANEVRRCDRGERRGGNGRGDAVRLSARGVLRGV
jgi:hypothetical protein